MHPHCPATPPGASAKVWSGQSDERAAVWQAVRGMVLIILAAVLLTLLQACTLNTFVSGTDRVDLRNLGSRTKAESITVGAINIKGWDDNATPAFKAVLTEVGKMWKGYLTANALKWIGGKYYDHQNQIVNQDTTLKLESLRNARSEADAAHALKVLEANHAAEAAGAAAPPLEPSL